MWSNCASQSNPYAGNHVDCIQTTGWRNVLIERSSFKNCIGTTLQMGTEKAKSWNITIRNSMFSGLHWVNFTCGGSCGGDYAYVSPDADGNQTFVRLYHNTFGPTNDNPSLRLQEIDPAADIVLVGNIIHGSWNGCTVNSDSFADASIDTAAYNMIGSGSKCGSTDFVGSPTYVQPNPTQAGYDLHLVPSSNGVNDAQLSSCAVSVDFDGQSRPQGSACDVGADEVTGSTLRSTLPDRDPVATQEAEDSSSRATVTVTAARDAVRPIFAASPTTTVRPTRWIFRAKT
jgi:hypothetical protein